MACGAAWGPELKKAMRSVVLGTTLEEYGGTALSMYKYIPSARSKPRGSLFAPSSFERIGWSADLLRVRVRVSACTVIEA